MLSAAEKMCNISKDPAVTGNVIRPPMPRSTATLEGQLHRVTTRSLRTQTIKKAFAPLSYLTTAVTLSNLTQELCCRFQWPRGPRRWP
jgi:hypothetical protein